MNLTVRLLSAAIGIPIILLFVCWDWHKQSASLPMTCAVAVCALIGAWEYFRAIRLRGYCPSEYLAYAVIILLQFVAWYLTLAWSLLPLLPLLCCLLGAIALHLGLRDTPHRWQSIGLTYLGIVYVGWLFSYLIFLRSLPGVVTVSLGFFPLPEMARGIWMVLYMMAVTWTNDTGAMVVGRFLGKTPLAPTLSPGKTREGGFGGLVFGTVMSVAWGSWIGIPLAHCLILGVLLSILAQLGDLFESGLKRSLGIKDFGSLLPGHGGMLDRFDSVFFTAPIAYYYAVFFLG